MSKMATGKCIFGHLPSQQSKMVELDYTCYNTASVLWTTKPFKEIALKLFLVQYSNVPKRT